MNDYHLLIAGDVVDILLSLPKKERELLRSHIARIAANPSLHRTYLVKDDVGRDLDVHVAGRNAIVYWLDHADRQVKIIDLLPVDS